MYFTGAPEIIALLVFLQTLLERLPNTFEYVS